MENTNHEKHHIVSYVSHAWVWIALLILTVVTVAVAQLHLPKITVAVALTIASIKAAVVAIYFMHLKFESKVLVYMFILTIIVFLSFVLTIFLDYSFR